MSQAFPYLVTSGTQRGVRRRRTAGIYHHVVGRYAHFRIYREKKGRKVHGRTFGPVRSEISRREDNRSVSFPAISLFLFGSAFFFAPTLLRSKSTMTPSGSETPDMASAIKLLLITCVLLVCTVMGESEEGQTGRSRVSDEQLNMALSDQRYLRRQLKCALGEAPCDPVGRRLKSLAPLVLRGSCPQCSPEETRQIKKVLSHIQRTYPKEWSKIVQQYAGVS